MFGEDDKTIPPDLTRGITKSLILKCKVPSNCEIMSLPGTGHLIENPNMPVLSLSNHALFPKQQMTFGGSNTVLHSVGQINVWGKLLDFFKTLNNNYQLK